MILFSGCERKSKFPHINTEIIKKNIEKIIFNENIDPSSVRYDPAEKAKIIKTLPEGQMKLVVLSYHHIDKPAGNLSNTTKSMFVTPENFEKQMKYLYINGFTTITIDQLTNALDNHAPLPKKPVLLTFDDGYKSFYENAFPVLKKYNFHAVTFIIAGYFGKGRDELYMTKKMIKEISDSGLIEIASHTMSHPFLAKISPAAVDYELKQSKKILSDITGKEIKYIAYPYGSVNSYIINRAAALGYKAGFGVYKDYIHYKNQQFLHSRVSVQYTDNLSMFAKKVEIY